MILGCETSVGKIAIDSTPFSQSPIIEHLKFFVNDELIGVSTLYFDKHLGKEYDPNITNVSFYSMMRVTTVNCFDNFYVSKEYKMLDLESDDVSDSRGK